MGQGVLVGKGRAGWLGSWSGWRPLGSVLLALALIVLLWEGAKLLFEIKPYKLPHTYEIAREFFTPLPQGGPLAWLLLKDGLVTWTEAAAGFLLGGALGFLLAAWFVHSPLMERGLLPYAIASQTVPIVAIAPMVVVWLGTGMLSKVVIASYLTFFPVTVNSLRGFKSVEQDALDLMRSYASSRWQVFWKLRLPASLPYLFTALKISATLSVIGAIVGELPAGSTKGIGVAIVNAAQYNTFQPARLWVAIITAAAVGLAFYSLVVLAERRIVRWQPGEPA